ncbi:MAG TPA: S41 family peptidase [Cytophagaceae bacterium]
MTKSFLYRLLAILFWAGITSCKKDNPVPPPNHESNNYFYTYLKEWYLWNENIPAVNPSSYSSPSELLEVVKYKVYDRWSYVTTTEEFQKLFEQGQFKSYGYNVVLTGNNELRVSMVYANSPMGKAGVTRATKILKVNNTPVGQLISNGTINNELNKESNTFEIEDTTGAVRNINVSKAEFTLNTVLHKQIIPHAGKNVGYLVFSSFLETSVAELDNAFSYFKSNGVDELVLDLRYNGGGRVDVANHLAGLIVGDKANGQILSTYTHNNKQALHNYSDTIKGKANGLSLNRVFIISGSGTASASEIIINGLKPYIEVKLIGDKTHGKPVGMYAQSYKGFTMVPITFKIVNAQGQSDYFNGINVDANRLDDVTKDFGNKEEDRLEEALYFIENGHFSSSVARVSYKAPVVPLKGLNAEAGCL